MHQEHKTIEDVVNENLANWLSIGEYEEALNLASRHCTPQTTISIAKKLVIHYRQEGMPDKAFAVADLYVPSMAESCAKDYLSFCYENELYEIGLELAHEYFPEQVNNLLVLNYEFLLNAKKFELLIPFVEDECPGRLWETLEKVIDSYRGENRFVEAFDVAYQYDVDDACEELYPYAVAQKIKVIETELINGYAAKDKKRKEDCLGNAVVAREQLRMMLSDFVEPDEIFSLPNLDGGSFREVTYESLEEELNQLERAIEASKGNIDKYLLQKEFNRALEIEDYLRAGEIKKEMDEM